MGKGYLTVPLESAPYPPAMNPDPIVPYPRSLPMTDNLAEMTAEIVAAYVENNTVAAADLPKVIATVHAALSHLGQPAEDQPDTMTKLTAAQIRKSITPDKLISFIDGKGYSLLKRHLSTHGLTPATYREQFG